MRRGHLRDGEHDGPALDGGAVGRGEQDAADEHEGRRQHRAPLAPDLVRDVALAEAQPPQSACSRPPLHEQVSFEVIAGVRRDRERGMRATMSSMPTMMPVICAAAHAVIT